GIETFRRSHYAGTVGMRRVAGSRRQEDRRPYARVQTGAHPAGDRSRGSHLAEAAVRAFPRHPEKPREDARPRAGGRPRIPHRAAPPRAGTGARRRARPLCRRRRRCHRRPRTARYLQAIPKKSTSVKITEKEVRNVAGLANLNLTEEEIARMQSDLDGIL